MLGPNAQRVLLLFLWITPHVLLTVLAVVIWQRRLHREFPCFFAYVLFRVAAFVLLFTLFLVQGMTGSQYAYTFSVTLLIMIALSFGVIDEVSRYLFRESQLLKESAKRLLQGVGGLLLGVGVLLAVYAPGNNSIKWHAGVTVVNRGAAMIQCGLLLSLLLFSRFLGLSWRRPAFGITLGLAILTSVDLAASALRAEFVSDAAREFLNLLTTGTYLVCVSIWMRYLAAPEPEDAPQTMLPNDLNEVEIWNKELQHFLKQ